MSDEAVFLGRQAEPADAKFCVIPAPMDNAAVMVKGQNAAPAAILTASNYLETYDEEIARAPADEAPVFTIDAPDEPSIGWVQEQCEAAIDAVAVPVTLGGDPSVSLGGIQALAGKSEDFTILHIAAGANLKSDPTSAGAVMRQALGCENLQKIVQVGVRSLSAEESEVVFGDESRIETFFACDLARQEDGEGWHEDVIQELATPVYLSIDLSGLDRSVVTSVGNPEPGGLQWWEALRLLKKVASRRRIAGFDVVDLVPIEGDMNGDYAAARLVYKVMAYMVAGGKMF
jgi:agmatinase